MTIHAKIIQALKPFGMPVKPDLYTGTEKRYIIFNYADDRAVLFADNAPLCVVAYMQIHLFIPLDEDYLNIKSRIRKALFDAGFTYPEVTEQIENDTKKRHIIFECEIEEESEES